MWKKLLWIYLGLYGAAILYGLVSQIIENVQVGEINIAGYIFILLMFAPALAVALGLKGKKVHILLVLFGLLVIAVPLAGIFNFNEMNLETIGKALLFAPMLIGLFYYGFKGFFRRKNA